MRGEAGEQREITLFFFFTLSILKKQYLTNVVVPISTQQLAELNL